QTLSRRRFRQGGMQTIKCPAANVGTTDKAGQGRLRPALMGKEMQGLFFETDNGVRYVLRALVVLLGFWTAWRTGRSVADGWGDYTRVVIYTLALGLVMRFLHHALFNGPFINGF